MNWIMLFIAYIIGAISMFMLVCMGYTAKQEEPVNRVHFYVARDKNGELWLYIGKPYRGRGKFFGDLKKGSCTMCCNDFEIFGINGNDYKDLKWEDEPVEVFLNLED